MVEKNTLNPTQVRKHILNMAHSGQSVHVACAFSIVEILCAITGEVMLFNPSNPARDYLVLSKGHGVMALYACMMELGHLNPEDADLYFKDGSRLHGLAEATIPGIDASTGSLGHGLPIAVGMAYGLKRLGSSQRVYCIVGDGELNEGSCWEAILFAGHHKLNNLTIIVDENGLQAMGETQHILYLDSIQEKMRAFGFLSTVCNGHDPESLLNAIRLRGPAPKAIVARTIKGRGVSFMENDNRWHYTRLTHETYSKALAALA